MLSVSSKHYFQNKIKEKGRERTYGCEEEVVVWERAVADRHELDALPLRVDERRVRRVAFKKKKKKTPSA